MLPECIPVIYFRGSGWISKWTLAVACADAALAWAEANAPAAVKVTRSILKSELPAGEAVPGVEKRTGREFFAKAGGRAHPCASGPACVVGVGTVDKRGERCGECVAADGAKP